MERPNSCDFRRRTGPHSTQRCCQASLARGIKRDRKVWTRFFDNQIAIGPGSGVAGVPIGGTRCKLLSTRTGVHGTSPALPDGLQGAPDAVQGGVFIVCLAGARLVLITSIQ